MALELLGGGAVRRLALARGEADKAREYIERIRTFSPYFRLTPSETS